MSDRQDLLGSGLDFDQLQLALGMSGVSVWRMDIASGQVHINAAGYRLLGLPARAAGWHVEDLMGAVHPDDRDAMIEGAHQARIEGRPIEVLARFRHEDGGWRHVLTRRMAVRGADGKLAYFLGMAIDVTERVRDEQRLHAANQRIALIARTAGIGTWEWDLQTGRSQWDDQMYLLRGLTPGSPPMTLQEMTALLHPDDREAVGWQIERTMRENLPTQYEFRVLLPGGGVRWLASRSVPMLDDHGRPARRIGVNWDVTDSRQAQVERQAKAMAERESAAKSELLARMSHELRTPLNAILGFTELLMGSGDNLAASARQARLEHIQSAGRHLLALINDVLELARPGGGNAAPHTPVPVRLDALFADTLPLVEGAAAERGISLRRDPCEPPGLAAVGDPLWLKQVLLNLLTNAVKYNRRGGWIDLSARPTRDDRVCITVRDGGHGMSAAALARVFEPFHRAAERRPGAPGVGIGLAVVKTLMARMGGEVAVRSTLGAGSEFELLLPLAPEGMAEPPDSGFAPLEASPPPAPMPPVMPPVMPAPAPVPAATPSSSARRATLLYIEDNPVNVMIVQELAARWPELDFRSAVDGTSGLASAVELRPALILLDMQLPDLHGLEVMARLRADPRTRETPCIALSANAMPDDIAHALASGFTDYWTKPLDFALFGQAIDRLTRPLRVPPATAG